MSDYKTNTAGLPEIIKSTPGVLDYSFKWSDWLAAITDTIASYEITAATGITLDRHNRDGGVVTAWLSGGRAGSSYRITCKIVTIAGRTDSRTIVVKVAAER